MNVLIKQVKILDKFSPYNNEIKDVLIEQGFITKILDNSDAPCEIINGDGLFLSLGWFDMRVTSGEPGFEHKEDIESLCDAASAGGFTEIACLPNTNPVIHSKNMISFIKSKCKDNLVEIHPMGSVTHNREGKEITEMMDLHYAGAVAFTDADLPVWHSDVLLKSLEYLKTFDGLLINHAEDNQISHYGQMNESIESTSLGLKGIPSIAEELIVERDISILRYAGGKIHFPHISSAKSLELIRSAKKEGLQVTCDIAAYQIALSDDLIRSFDTSLKVNPPLRNKHEIDLLKEFLIDDTIDAIVSDHIPQDIESKNLEFGMAEFGMIGLETAYAIINGALENHLSIEMILNKIVYNPRQILKLNLPKIDVGIQANMTLFDPNLCWTFTNENIKSKSKNSPFIGKTLKGRAKAVFNKNIYKILY